MVLQIRSKFNNNCKDRFLGVSNIDDNFYYYNKLFKEVISLDNFSVLFCIRFSNF